MPRAEASRPALASSICVCCLAQYPTRSLRPRALLLPPAPEGTAPAAGAPAAAPASAAAADARCTASFCAPPRAMLRASCVCLRPRAPLHVVVRPRLTQISLTHTLRSRQIHIGAHLRGPFQAPRSPPEGVLRLWRRWRRACRCCCHTTASARAKSQRRGAGVGRRCRRRRLLEQRQQQRRDGRGRRRGARAHRLLAAAPLRIALVLTREQQRDAIRR